jgi:hypothetical protein
MPHAATRVEATIEQVKTSAYTIPTDYSTGR